MLQMRVTIMLLVLAIAQAALQSEQTAPPQDNRPESDPGAGTGSELGGASKYHHEKPQDAAEQNKHDAKENDVYLHPEEEEDNQEDTCADVTVPKEGTCATTCAKEVERRIGAKNYVCKEGPNGFTCKEVLVDDREDAEEEEESAVEGGPHKQETKGKGGEPSAMGKTIDDKDDLQ